MSEAVKWALPYADALAAAHAANSRFAPMIRRGSLILGVYAPRDEDPQQPHDQDEVYIVSAGTGEFVRGDDRVRFGPGDALFVPAGMTHRFENFSDDFATWVAFYGPSGGEPEIG